MNRRKDKKKDIPIKFKPSDITQDDIKKFVEVRKEVLEIYKKAIELDVKPYYLIKGRKGTEIIINPKIADALKLKRQ